MTVFFFLVGFGLMVQVMWTLCQELYFEAITDETIENYMHY